MLQLAKGRCKLHVELKTMGDEYEGIEEKVIALIYRHGMKEEVVLSSFDHDSMKRANEINPAIRTGLIFMGKPMLLTEQLRCAGAASVSMHYAFVTRNLVNEMTENGIDMGVWTVDDPDILAGIVEQYPDMRITTNYPDRVLRIMRGNSVRS